MNLLSLDSVTKANGEKELFTGISFGLDEGQKAALIGVNGCGKSTLLKMIAGMEAADSGTISRNRTLSIGYLEQIPEYKKGDTILDHIFQSDNPRNQLVRKYEELVSRLHLHYDEKIQNEMNRMIEEMEKLKIWNYENEIQSLIKNLGIEDLELQMENLSGGMLKKVALAKALIGDFNLLLLDEPTNHLDLETILWLQEHLRKSPKAMIMVTHDRYFLDSVCNSIYEIDRKSLTYYQGNYSYYLEKKAASEENMRREDEKIEGLLRKELEWLKRGPKARATKQKARIERIAGMTERERYSVEETIELSVTGRRLGNKVLAVKDISKSYGEKVIIKPFTHIFKQKEKIGFLGPNGSGKTTLLNLLTERIPSDSGSIDKGIHTHFGYFDQHSGELQPDQLLIDYIKQSAEVIDLGKGRVLTAARMLEKFLFPTMMHYTPVGQLSGGEKRRLYLLSILMKNPNFLILDEPTNDLDLKTLSILEEFLNDFEGCLILISHDRYFLDRTVDYLFLFDGKSNVTGYPGSCSDYLEEQKELKEEEENTRRESAKKAAPPKTVTAKNKLSYKEKAELEKLPGEIDALEKEKAELEGHFSSGVYDPEKLKTWNIRFEEIKKLLDSMYRRWEELMGKE